MSSKFCAHILHQIQSESQKFGQRWNTYVKSPLRISISEPCRNAEFPLIWLIAFMYLVELLVCSMNDPYEEEPFSFDATTTWSRNLPLRSWVLYDYCMFVNDHHSILLSQCIWPYSRTALIRVFLFIVSPYRFPSRTYSCLNALLMSCLCSIMMTSWMKSLVSPCRRVSLAFPYATHPGFLFVVRLFIWCFSPASWHFHADQDLS